MNRQNFVIVIGREFGSGGRALGRELSSRLGLPYYDKELLVEAARRLGLRADLLEKADERPPSPFRSIMSASIGSQSWLTTGALQPEVLHQLQSKVIEAIIKEGPCVIVGRSADYIARNHPGLVSVFLHADLQERLEKVAARTKSKPTKELREKITRRDSSRREYYNYFTGRDWGKASNYHLCIDTTGLDISKVADVVEAYLKTRS